MKKYGILSAVVLCAAFAAPAAHADSYSTSNTDYCREYQRTIYVGGRPEQGYGTACMQVDGSWQIVSGNDAPVGTRVEPVYIIQERPVVYQTRYYSYPQRPLFYSGFHRPHHSGTSISFSFGNDRRSGYRHNDWNDRRGHSNRSNHRDNDRGRGDNHHGRH